MYSFTGSYVDNLAFTPLKHVSYTHRDATDILHPRNQASVQTHSTKTVNFFSKSPFSYVFENIGNSAENTSRLEMLKSHFNLSLTVTEGLAISMGRIEISYVSTTLRKTVPL